MLSLGTREAFNFGKELKVFQVSDPRAERAVPTRRSAENDSQVMQARPASDPFFAVHDLTRPVSFSSSLDLTNPTREI